MKRWMLVSPTLLVLFMGLLLAVCANGQDHWVHRRISGADGLPQNSVLHLLPDSLGFLWISTEAGLARFDGQRVRRIRTSGAAHRGPDRMRQLFRGCNGSVMATDGGGNAFLIKDHYLVTKQYELGNVPNVSGGLPFSGLLKVLARKPIPLAGADRWDGITINLLPVDSSRWFAVGRDHLYGYQGTDLTDSTALDTTYRWYFVCDRQLLALSREGQVMWSPIDRPSFAPGKLVFQGGEEPALPLNGKLFWNCGDTTAVLLSQERPILLHLRPSDHTILVEPLDIELPSSTPLLSATWLSGPQVLGLGTMTQGLWLYYRVPFQRFAFDPTGGDKGVIGPLMRVTDTTAIAFTHEGRALIIPENGRTREVPCVRSMTSSGIALWKEQHVIYGSGKATMRLDLRNGQCSELYRTEGSPSCYLVNGDTIWSASPTGVDRWVNGQMNHVFTSTNAIITDPTYFLRKGKGGQILIGTEHGLYELRHDASCSVVPGTEGYCVRALADVGPFTLLGTYGNGGFAWYDGAVVPLPLSSHDGLGHIHSFSLDRSGLLWLSTNRGLFRLSMKELENTLRYRTPTEVRTEWLGDDPGSKDLEFNGGSDPSLAAFADGRLFYPTMNGTVMFDPSRVPLTPPFGSLMIEAILIDGIAADLRSTGPVQVPANSRSIDVRFSIARWRDLDDPYLDFGLLDMKDQWRKLSDQEEGIMDFGSPPPGDHILCLRATVPGKVPIVLWQRSIHVAAPFYQTVSGMFIIGAGSVLLSWVLYSWGARRSTRRRLELERLVAARTEALSIANQDLVRSADLKDRFFTILNHDIVSPLKFITRVARDHVSDADKDSMEERLAVLRDISFASERTYSNAQNLLNWVKQQDGRIRAVPAHAVVNLLIEDAFDRIRPQAVGHGTNLINEVPLDDVILVDSALLSIVLNNLLINAIANPQVPEIRVTSRAFNHHYELRITDNGPGLPDEIMERIERIKAGDHTVRGAHGGASSGLGFMIVEHIMSVLEGSFEVESTNENGTAFLLMLPMGAQLP